MKNTIVNEYIEQLKYTEACEILDAGFEDAFQYTVAGHGHNRLKSTNVLERLNEEVRRRENVIRIFPNQDRSEEHTSELQSRGHLVCRLLLEKKNRTYCRKQSNK